MELPTNKTCLFFLLPVFTVQGFGLSNPSNISGGRGIVAFSIDRLPFSLQGTHTCSSGLPEMGEGRFCLPPQAWTCNNSFTSLQLLPCICLGMNTAFHYSVHAGKFLVPVLVPQRPELGTTNLFPSLNPRCSSLFQHLFIAQLPRREGLIPAHDSCNCCLCSCRTVV